MGANGRKRALEMYDWKAIIPSYEDLWSELKSRRNAEHDHSPQINFWASRLDPFYGFASYPTRKIRLQSALYLSEKNSHISINRFRTLIKLEMVNYVLDRMSPQQQLESVLIRLGSGSATAETLISEICSQEKDKRKLFLSIAWMVKLGLIGLERRL